MTCGWVKQPVRRMELRGAHSVGRLRHVTIKSPQPSLKMKVSTRNKAAGEANIVKGKVKAVAGKITRNVGLQVRGRVQEAVGRVQKDVGQQQKTEGY